MQTKEPKETAYANKRALRNQKSPIKRDLNRICSQKSPIKDRICNQNSPIKSNANKRAILQGLGSRVQSLGCRVGDLRFMI
jgi:hypothetical protein